MILENVNSPADLRVLDQSELVQLADEIRAFVVEAVSATGGHLGSNLGAVELTLAVHRVFDSPRDVILWDTGHQAYVHKLVTGRRAGFAQLRQAGGLSGYPSRGESEHDWVENSHASTILSYAHGISTAIDLGAQGDGADRRVVAIVGDGALTGGMAYEALNNLGHSGRRVVIVLNDNGRSYAPTVSHLSESLTRLRLNPSYVQARNRVKQFLRDVPAIGGLAYTSAQGLTAALREVIEPHVFFESLGVRYTGPLDGHDIEVMEQALRHAAEWEGPIVVHVLTHKGKGYAPAEDDQVQRLHDLKVRPANAGPTADGDAPIQCTDAFTQAMVELGEDHPSVVAITAAMPGPTGLLPFQSRFPDRCFDVGIAEQHAVTAAAGMAMMGLRPVVAVYSTFLCRAFDQTNLDVGLHGLPVVFALDRAGITGDDGPSHHGVLDLALTLAIPGMTVFAPSSAQELPVMLRTALELDGPAAVRYPKGPARQVDAASVGSGTSARKVRQGDGTVCILAVGKLLADAEQAADELATEGIGATIWDVRVVKPPDLAMLTDAAGHGVVVTVEDGIRVGGAGAFLVDAMAALDATRRIPPVLVLGVPVAYIPQGKPAQILADLGLDGRGIAASVRNVLETSQTAAPFDLD
ncbi:MAG TPA: 1-deoxy-D-xylulose-5-phosphate synthase [Acidimicrobiales bacterium]|jgi:1-deoxy-D-xylulose-5-phosphate synthase|nr:1-deoxy-D-xylulose-5-phosphate synthase [Acidimicrobiales bacterium]